MFQILVIASNGKSANGVSLALAIYVLMYGPGVEFSGLRSRAAAAMAVAASAAVCPRPSSSLANLETTSHAVVGSSLGRSRSLMSAHQPTRRFAKSRLRAVI